jgi:beta-carotene hydroxylase
MITSFAALLRQPNTGSKNMRLRFVEDRRTLVWAFVLFPLGPAAACWRPSLWPWLTPLFVYCSYLSGVLSHNHNHCPVFTSRRANLAYGAWLSFFYGFPTFAWLPTHNQNHHRFLNGEGDVTRTSRLGLRDGLLALLIYPLASSRFQLPLVVRCARSALAGKSALATRVTVESLTLLLGHAAALGAFVAAHGPRLGALAYAASLGAPALFGSYWMMLTNYLQHVGCDPASSHDHSRNFVNPIWNWFVFDNGYHTVHHQHPGLHWSRYRALHRLTERRMVPELNQPSIASYVLSRYLLGRSRRSDAGAHGSSTVAPPDAGTWAAAPPS